MNSPGHPAHPQARPDAFLDHPGDTTMKTPRARNLIAAALVGARAFNTSIAPALNVPKASRRNG